MSRKEAREEVFKLIFEFCFSGEKNEFSLNEVLSNNDVSTEKKYITDVYSGVIENYDKLSEMIKSCSNSFAFDRIYKVDLAILLVALFETKFYDIPKAVAINEAVNLAKEYSTEKSATFVNGILASLVKE